MAPQTWLDYAANVTQQNHAANVTKRDLKNHSKLIAQKGAKGSFGQQTRKGLPYA